MSEKRGTLDLTQGKINTVLLKFALPFVASGMVLALHGVISMLVVGRFTDSQTISGVATGTQMMFPPMAFMMGLGTSGTVLIGKCIGKRDMEAGTKALGSFAIVSIALVTFLTLFILFLREPLISILRTPEDAIPSARRFVLLSTIGVPFNTAYGMISAVARGMGNSKTPSIAAGVSCAVNIALSLILVGVFGMAEAGVAIASSIAQFVSFVHMAIWICKIKLPFPFAAKDLRADKESMKFLFVVGIPLILQELLISISFMINTNRVNNLGVEASASVGVVSRVFNVAGIIPQSIGSAISAITAQNIGAGKPERAISSLRWGILYAAAINAVILVLSQLWPESITSVFAKDQAIIVGAASYLRSFSIEALLIAFTFCMNAYLSGVGKSHVSMWHILATSFLVRVPLSIWIAGIEGINLNDKLFYLGLASPLATIISLFVGLLYIIWYLKKQKEETVL